MATVSASGSTSRASIASVGVREFRAHMGEYMERVGRGEVITLLSRGRPVAVVTPTPMNEASAREGGFLIGTPLEHAQWQDWTDEELRAMFGDKLG